MRKSHRYKLVFFILSGLAVFICNEIQAAEFFGLGGLPGGMTSSSATGISADGSVVVGMGRDDTGRGKAFHWTATNGMVSLGDLGSGGTGSHAYGVSDDGNVVVGVSGTEAFRWTATDGMVGLGDLPGGYFLSAAYDVSDDGSVVVGYGHSDSGVEAFRWTAAGGMNGLGTLPGGSFTSFAYGVSSDGSVVVGSSGSANGIEAFRWAATGGMVGLGDLPGGLFESVARGVSADGSVVVGYGSGTNGMEAFRWTAKDGMIGLGVLSQGGLESVALNISGDGRVIVGYSKDSSGNQAFRWVSSEGMKSIYDLLVDNGIDLTGWQLNYATATSYDGTVIVGDGVSPNGNEAWLARIDSGLITPAVIAESVKSVLPITESGHGLARENLDTQMQAARHFRGRSGSNFDLYAAGFGGEWNSYTAGSTVGLALNVTNEVRVGGGVFAGRYKEDDLKYSGEYELDAVGGALWIGYEVPNNGPQLHVVGMMADLDNEIERGYLNGSGLDSSEGNPDGHLSGVSVRGGWKVAATDKASITPFISYTWTEIEIDSYDETGGGFPAHFDRRRDNAEIIKIGLEGEYHLSNTITAWGQAAYGKRLDEDSTGLSGEILGLMDVSLPGYELDDEWAEVDLGMKWQASQNFSVMATGGSAFANDQNPDWRTSLGLSWAFL